MKNIYVVGEAKHYADFIEGANLVDEISEADIVVFTGGEDVTPSLYGASLHPKTFCNPLRDKSEISVFNSIRPNQMVIGVCRGSQLLCMLNGGKLVQHVTGHGLFHTHSIYNVETGTCYEITSTHHQMQYPYNLDGKDYSLLYISTSNRSTDYEGDCIDSKELKSKGEPEIVLYHKENFPKCLAIQGHPEYMRKDSPTVKMLNNLINSILKTLN